MAYGSKLHIIHKVKIGPTTATFQIDLLENGFVGTSEEKRGTKKVFEFGYEGADVKSIWDNPIQKGYLDLFLLVQDAADEAILDAIIAGDEKQYQLQLSIDSVVKWTGFVIPDIIEYSEGPYPYGARISAKDLHLLESESFPNNSAISYDLLVTEYADLLSASGLSLGMYIYNDWTAINLDSLDDYFNQVFFDEFQLQDFSSFSEGNFGQLNKLEALKALIPPGFILRQYNNKWQLIDLAHLGKDSGIVTRYEYDSAGVKVAKTTGVDLTTDVDRVDSFLLGTSTNKPYPGIKRAELKFNHKTSIQHILFDPSYTHDNSADSSSESIKVSDTTDRVVVVAGSVEVTTDTNPGSFRTGDAELVIFVGDYELSLSTGSWGTGTGEQQVSVSGSDTTLTGSFFVSSADIPVDIDEDTLTMELRWASVTGETVTQVVWSNLSLELINGGSVANDATTNFRLEQSGDYSTLADIGTVIIGQGPNSHSNSALRYFSTGGQFLQLNAFSHIGGSTFDYGDFILKNILNLQRVFTKSIDADLWAFYDPINVLTYKTDNYVFLNGSINGYDSKWRGEFVQLSWNTGTDTFSEFFKVSSGDAGTSIPPGSGEGPSLGELKDVFLEEDNNLSDLADAPTALTNLGLTATAAELNVLDGITATTAQLNKLAGTNAQIQSNLGLKDGTAALSLSSLSVTNALSASTLRPDSGKFLSPVSYAFRNAGDTAFRDVEMAGLTATSVTDSSLTATGILYAGAGGLLSNSGNATLDGAGNSVFGQVQSIFQLFIRDTFKTSETLPFIYATSNNGASYPFSPSDLGNVVIQARSSSPRDILLVSGDPPSIKMSVDRNGDVSVLEGGLIVNESSFSGTETLRVAGDSLLEGTVDITGTLDVTDDVAISGALTVSLDATFNDAVFINAGLFTKEFTSDVTRVMLTRQIGVGGGVIGVVSDATVGSEVISFHDEDGNVIVPVADNDLITIQHRTGLNSGTVVKSIKRKVVADAQPGGAVSLTTVGVTTGTDVGVIAEGDQAVVMGNTTNVNRDGLIEVNVADLPIPAFRFKDGITDFGGGTEVMRVGGLDPGGANEFSTSLTGDIGMAGKVGGNLAFAVTDTEALIAGFSFDNEHINANDILTSGQFNLFADNSAADFSFSGLGAGVPTIALHFSPTDVDSNRVYVTMGETYSGGWTGRYGFSMAPAKFDEAYFEVSRDMTTSALTAKIAGADFDNTGMWGGGDGTKEGASVRLDFANGQILYDAISETVWSQESVAAFTEDATATVITNDEWHSLAAVSSNGSNTARDTKVRKKYFKRFGVNTLILSGKARTAFGLGAGSGGQTESRIYVDLGGLESFTEITATSASDFTVELDISSLADDVQYELNVDVWAFAERTIGGSGSPATVTDTFLREDITVIATA